MGTIGIKSSWLKGEEIQKYLEFKSKFLKKM